MINGPPSVLDTIVRSRSKEPAEIIDAVFDRLKNHSGEIPSPDDLTLLVLRS